MRKPYPPSWPEIDSRSALADYLIAAYPLTTRGILYDAATTLPGGKLVGVIEQANGGTGDAYAPLRFGPGALSQRHYSAASGTPFSMSCWVRPSNSDINIDCIVALGGDSSPGSDSYLAGTTFSLYANVNSGGDFFVTQCNIALASAGGVLQTNQWSHVVFTYAGGNISSTTCKAYINGAEVALTNQGAPAPMVIAAGYIEVGCDYTLIQTDRGFRGQLQNLLLFRKTLSSSEATELYEDPWGIYKAQNRKTVVSLLGVTSAAVTHDTSGDLAAAVAEIAGAAAHLTLHATSGALAADAATIAGTAAHQHAATGALSADAAAVAGTASHLTLHATSGALSAAVATIVGAAAHERATAGALSADVATVAGTAVHLTLHATSGELAADAATLAGIAERAVDNEHATTGELVAGASNIAGTAAHLTLHATTGALAADAAAIASSAAHEHATIGTLISSPATITGTAVHRTLHETTGALIADVATIVGTAFSFLGGYPDPATVLSGIQYGPTGTEYTGTYTCPIDASIKFDIKTGLLVKPITNKIVMSL